MKRLDDKTYKNHVVAIYVTDSSDRDRHHRDSYDVFSAAAALSGAAAASQRGATPPMRFPGPYLAPPPLTLIGGEVQ